MNNTCFSQVGIEAMAYSLPSEVYTSERLELELGPLYKG